MKSNDFPETSVPAPQSEQSGWADLDLTPQGLAGTPAHEEDPESLVYAGNS